METKSRYETLPLYLDFPEKKIEDYTVFFDRPYTDTYIDMLGKECISHPVVLAYRDMPLEEVLQKSIQISIEKDCRVVIMKTMECFDRH